MAFKVTLKSDSLARAEASVRDGLKKVLNGAQLKRDIGDTVIQDIQFQTRKANFAPLSEKWIKERKQIAKATAVHEAYSPRRSNLTLSGQLLDSLQMVNSNNGVFEFKFVGDHEPYKAPYQTQWKRLGKIVRSSRSGLRTIGKKIKNEKLATYVQEQGREFVKLRPALVPRLRTIILRYIRRSSRVLGLFK